MTMTLRLIAAAFAALLAAAPGLAFDVPEHDHVHELEFQHPDLWWGTVFRPVHELEGDLARGVLPDLASLDVRSDNAYFDLRTGRWGTLIITRPMIPGRGVRNDLQWSDLGRSEPRDRAGTREAAWHAFRDFLAGHAEQLRLDAAEFGEPTVSMHGERLIQIYLPRQFDRIPVRDSFVTASINSGNLVLMGQRNWGDIDLDTAPTITADQATEAVRRYLQDMRHSDYREAPQLVIVPVSPQPNEDLIAEAGAGLNHRLVWVLSPIIERHIGTWEALVDAHSGELLSFTDTNQYASRQVGGGVYPVSNDGQPPDGVEQPFWPMPFANISLDGTPVGFTTTGGNVPTGLDPGTISTTLNGQYVRINDNCGAINESSAAGDLDLGDGPGTDCAVPPGGSAGNTHASRSGFYELNRIIEQGRGYLPDNSWLQGQLTANMNLTHMTCNATWSGQVNFFRSSGSCANTGEIAAVFDHEWGHGMDANDGAPGISRPGEGIADIYAQNRLNDSCVGRGFRPGVNCGGFGDPCLDCTGVRESDWAKQQSGLPHDISWAIANCTGTGNSPCGRSVHCEGSIVAEAAWDLVHRDFQGFAGSDFNYDLNTALELGTRLSYYGSHTVGNWYQCNAGAGTGDGCNADGGYLNYLAANDDNGDLTDGTPHMSAIFAAFDRHQIACPTPAVQDAGCSGGPQTAPQNVEALALDEGVFLEWDPVPDAEEYWVFRTEGVHGCDFGKSRVGITTDTEFTEMGLRNEFEAQYSVVGVGASDACTSPMSACTAVTPLPGPSGTIEGTVTRAATGTPLAGALVQASGPATFSALTDTGGNYQMTVLEGTYDVTASAAGHTDATVVDIQVDEDAVVPLDFGLDTPIADASPLTFVFEVAGGGSAAGTLEIANEGSLDLVWDIETDAAQIVGRAGDSRDFDGDFAIANWTLENTPAGTGGSFNTNPGPPVELFVVGGDNNTEGDTDFWIEIPADGEISFDWGYQSGDTGDWDSGGFVVNGSYAELANNASQVPFFNQSETVAVSAGDIFAFRVHTRDGQLGAGTFGVTNFEFEPSICANPEAVPWLSTSPASGVTPPGNTDGVSVMVDGAGLAPGAYGAFLCMTSNDVMVGLIPIPVALTVTDGPADPGELVVDPATLDFGEVISGTSESLAFEVSNGAEPGAASLTLTAVTPDGDAEFELTGGDCEAGVTVLAPGDSCTVEATFSPEAEGIYSGDVTVEANGQSAVVAMSGAGIEPDPGELELSPAEVDFGEVEVDTTATDLLTLTNVGEQGAAAVQLSGIMLVGHAAFEDTGGGTCEAGVTELEPDESCTIEVSFTPAGEGGVAASVIVDGAGGKEAGASLSGSGVVPPAPVADITPDSFAFDVLQGDTDGDTLNIGNTGDAGLEWAFTDTAPAECAWDTTLGNPGGSLNALGLWNGTLYVGGSANSDFNGVTAGVAGVDLDTATVTPLGTTELVDGFVTSLVPYNDGNGERLFIVGAFNGIRFNGSELPDSRGVVAWDGSETVTLAGSPFAEPLVFAQAATVYDGQLVVAGAGGAVDPPQRPVLSLWDGSDWTVFREEFDGLVAPVALAVEEFQGELYFGGRFASIEYPDGNVVESLNIMGFDGENFFSVGGGLKRSTSIISQVLAMKTFDDGTGEALYIGGRFDSSVDDDEPMFAVARWDGSQLSAVGNGFPMPNEVRDFAVHDDGGGPALYAVGNYTEDTLGAPIIRAARLENGEWVEVAGGIGENPNRALSLPDGSLGFAGNFTEVGINPGTPGSGPSSGFAQLFCEVEVQCDNVTDVPWLNVDPAAGVTAPDSVTGVDVLVDAAGLDAGDYGATLCVTTNDPAATLVELPISLTVIEPDPADPGLLHVAPEVHDFGDLPAGDSGAVLVAVGNTADEGAGALILDVIELTGDGFTITNGDCDEGTELEAGESCTVEVTFSPDGAGEFDGTLSIDADDGAGGQTALVALSGTGLEDEPPPGTLAVDPVELDFGAVLVDNSGDQSVTVTNVASEGSADLEITQIEVISGGDVFAVDTDCGATLAAQESCTAMVEFTPADVTAYAGVLRIAADGETVDVPLSGGGVELPAEIFEDRFEEN